MEIIIIIWGDGGKKEVIIVYFQLVFKIVCPYKNEKI